MGEYDSMMEHQPNWQRAPGWAKYWVVADRGTAHWYECQPNLYANGWHTILGSNAVAGYFDPSWAQMVWRFSLVERNGKLYKIQVDPEWDKAPAWAQFWHYNRDGAAWWSEKQPTLKGSHWIIEGGGGAIESAGFINAVWAKANFENSLRQRPPATANPEPDWSTAPEWAQYFAINASGKSHWFFSKPIQRKNVWYVVGAENTAEGPLYHVAWAAQHWRESLRQRPVMVEYQPKWEEAPTWARYCTLDAVGRAHWFQQQPEPITNRADDRYWSAKYGQWQYYEDVDAPGQFGLDWTTMVYKRPFPKVGEYDYRKEMADALGQEGIDHLAKIKIAITELQRETEWRDGEIRELRVDLANALAEVARLGGRVKACRPSQPGGTAHSGNTQGSSRREDRRRQDGRTPISL